MKFLKEAVKHAGAPKFSITKFIQTHVGGYEPERSHKVVHASDMTNSSYCPRAVALMDLTDAKPKDRYIPTALRTTFDMGDAVSDLFRERWAGTSAVGHWRCLACNHIETFCTRPTGFCSKCGKTLWKYREVDFQSKTYGFSGSLDMIVDLGVPKFFPVELKIMASDEFAKLVAPLAEHRLRTSLYLYLIEDSLSPFRYRMNTQHAKICYVSRGYGKKNQDADGTVLPIKEFDIYRDDDSLAPFLEKAAAVKRFRESGVMPVRLCDTPSSPIAKSCPMVKACFSDKYPPGTIHKVPTEDNSNG
jgi:hypothetical protein